MSLSKHEQTQFERLTAGIMLDDPAYRRKIAKLDSSYAPKKTVKNNAQTTLNRIDKAVSNYSATLIAFSGILLIIGMIGILIDNQILSIAGGIGGTFLLLGTVIYSASVYRRTGNRSLL